MVLGQHEAAKLGAEMTPRPRRQGRHHISTLRGQPALAAQQNVVRPADQILNQIILVALEARTRRCLGRDYAPLIDRNPAFLGPTPRLVGRPTRLAPRPGFSIHAAGLDIRRPGKAFKAADLFTQHRVLGTQSRLIFKKF